MKAEAGGGEEQHGGVGGKESTASETAAKKRMTGMTGIQCEAESITQVDVCSAHSKTVTSDKLHVKL